MTKTARLNLAGIIIVIFALNINGLAFGQLINPSTDIAYLGAFRLPTDTQGSTFAYGVSGMTYYPNGDASGPQDGFPGSLYALSTSQTQYVAEISIPAPVNSKNLGSLNRAGTLQNFSNVTQGMYTATYKETEIAYLPRQGSQSSDKLYLSWNDWYNVADADVDRFGWCEINLSAPNTQGSWNLGNPGEVHVGDVGNYLFEIPATWAQAHTPGKLLVSGKYREGGCADGGVRYGGGPALHAYGPWNDGNPPNGGVNLDQITLLSYTGGHLWTCASTGDTCKVSDHWEGGVWITAGSKGAVILTGRKGIGSDYYGQSPNGCENKGYHNLGGYKPYMLFYNPADLAAVAAGTKQPHEPQPYTTMDGGSYAFNPGTQCSGGFSSAAYDRENQLLYVAEPFADNETPVIHVFKIKSGGTSYEKAIPLNLRMGAWVYGPPAYFQVS